MLYTMTIVFNIKEERCFLFLTSATWYFVLATGLLSFWEVYITVRSIPTLDFFLNLQISLSTLFFPRFSDSINYPHKVIILNYWPNLQNKNNKQVYYAYVTKYNIFFLD